MAMIEKERADYDANLKRDLDRIQSRRRARDRLHRLRAGWAAPLRRLSALLQAPAGQGAGKRAGQRCEHQRHHKGCAVYARLERVSPSCKLWSCRWLVNDDTGGLRRPDRSHYVLDLIPDFVTAVDDLTGERQAVQVVQIWVDPKHPDAHRDPALRAYLERRAKDNIIGLVRYDNESAIALFPPALSANRQWNEVTTAFREKEHTLDEVVEALGG
jgi:hypothetical protein